MSPPLLRPHPASSLLLLVLSPISFLPFLPDPPSPFQSLPLFFPSFLSSSPFSSTCYLPSFLPPSHISFLHLLSSLLSFYPHFLLYFLLLSSVFFPFLSSVSFPTHFNSSLFHPSFLPPSLPSFLPSSHISFPHLPPLSFPSILVSFCTSSSHLLSSERCEFSGLALTLVCTGFFSQTVEGTKTSLGNLLGPVWWILFSWPRIPSEACMFCTSSTRQCWGQRVSETPDFMLKPPQPPLSVSHETPDKIVLSIFPPV